jgi:8-oxo-dGTP diphosphatase
VQDSEPLDYRNGGVVDVSPRQVVCPRVHPEPRDPEDADLDLPTAEVIVAGVIVMDSRILLCYRSPGRRWYRDVWDLPGGHVEVGESSADALKRELLEELGIAAGSLTEHPLERLCTAEFELDLYAGTAWNGAPANLVPEEHDAIQWFAEEELPSLEMAHDSFLSFLGSVLNAR